MYLALGSPFDDNSHLPGTQILNSALSKMNFASHNQPANLGSDELYHH